MDKDTIELVKALVPLAWPIVVLIAAFVFREQVKDVARRVLKLPGGIELQPPKPQQTPESLPLPTVPTRTVLPPPTEPVADAMKKLNAELDTHFGNDRVERERVLVRALSEAQVQLRLEQVYTVIFGSQIALLRRLHHYGPQSKAEAEKIFEAAKGYWPQIHKDATFDTWLQYLVSVEFVTVEGETIKPTRLVPAFLTYVTSRALLMEAKAG